MAEPPSLRVMTGDLQRAAAFHREREALHAQQQAHHAQQEKLHGEERARHAEELAAASRHLAELQEMAERLGQVVQKSRLVPPETTEEMIGRKSRLSHAMDQVLESWPAELPFTASGIAGALRRRRDEGRLREVREGRPHLEAEYRKVE